MDVKSSLPIAHLLQILPLHALQIIFLFIQDDILAYQNARNKCLECSFCGLKFCMYHNKSDCNCVSFRANYNQNKTVWCPNCVTDYATSKPNFNFHGYSGNAWLEPERKPNSYDYSFYVSTDSPLVFCNCLKQTCINKQCCDKVCDHEKVIRFCRQCKMKRNNLVSRLTKLTNSKHMGYLLDVVERLENFYNAHGLDYIKYLTFQQYYINAFKKFELYKYSIHRSFLNEKISEHAHCKCHVNANNNLMIDGCLLKQQSLIEKIRTVATTNVCVCHELHCLADLYQRHMLIPKKVTCFLSCHIHCIILIDLLDGDLSIIYNRVRRTFTIDELKMLTNEGN